jgi:transposase-like protein
MQAREVWTSGDICQHYGISRGNFAYWRRQEDFPKPLTWSKNGGGVWPRADVRAWVQAFRAGSPETRAKRVDCVRRYREGATISALSRKHGVDRKTVRRWLSAAGALSQE